jgi:hypothetical protein
MRGWNLLHVIQSVEPVMQEAIVPKCVGVLGPGARSGILKVCDGLFGVSAVPVFRLHHACNTRRPSMGPTVGRRLAQVPVVRVDALHTRKRPWRFR